MNERAMIGRPAAYELAEEDVVRGAPPDAVAELVGGALRPSPRPTARYAKAGAFLGGALHDPFNEGRGGPGGWFIRHEPDLHLGADVLVPDLGGWRLQRMPHMPEAAGLEVVPDWVCEILSPATRAHDICEKRELYRRAGVGYLWLVDPDSRLLEAFALQDGAWTLEAALKDSDDVRVAPFDAIGFSLATLWVD